MESWGWYLVGELEKWWGKFGVFVFCLLSEDKKKAP